MDAFYRGEEGHKRALNWTATNDLEQVKKFGNDRRVFWASFGNEKDNKTRGHD